MMIIKYCPQCKSEMSYGKSLCNECEKKYDKKENDRYYNRFKRNKKTDKFYHSNEWKKISLFVLMRNNYRCYDCGKLATEVHHKKPIAEYWEERLNIDNLIPLCTSCHNKKRK